MQLSRFFTLAELTRSDTAQREGIPNQPAEAQIEQLRALCGALLDPLREAVGRPIRITSGYRGPALNARIGGSATSQHSQGQAADLQCPGLDVLELFKTVIRRGLPFDQVIYEAQSASVKWVHVSHRAGANRGEIRVAQFNAAGRPTGYPLVSAEQALAMRERTTRSGRATADPGHVERPDEPELAAAAAPAVPAAAATAKPAPAVKAPARKRAPNKAAAKKTTARKAAAKKAPAKEAPAQKAPAKKAPAKRATTTKTPPKQAPAAKAAAKKAPAARKAAVAEKAPSRPSTARKAVAGKKAPARRPRPR